MPPPPLESSPEPEYILKFHLHISGPHPSVLPPFPKKLIFSSLSRANNEARRFLGKHTILETQLLDLIEDPIIGDLFSGRGVLKGMTEHEWMRVNVVPVEEEEDHEKRVEALQRKEEEEEGELPVLRMMVHHHPTVYEGLKEMKRMEDAILEKLFEEYDWEEEEKGGKKMENTGGKREGKKGVVKAARKV